MVGSKRRRDALCDAPRAILWVTIRDDWADGVAVRSVDRVGVIGGLTEAERLVAFGPIGLVRSPKHGARLGDPGIDAATASIGSILHLLQWDARRAAGSGRAAGNGQHLPREDHVRVRDLRVGSLQRGQRDAKFRSDAGQGVAGLDSVRRHGRHLQNIKLWFNATEMNGTAS